MENPIEMDDLGVPLFLETPIFCSVSFDFFVQIYHHLRRISLVYFFSKHPPLVDLQIGPKKPDVVLDDDIPNIIFIG